MKILIITLLFSVSSYNYAKTTEDIPNARTLYKKELKKLHKSSWIKTFFPIPIVSTIFNAPQSWKNYFNCKTMYRYFKSAHIYQNKSLEKTRKYKKAKKRLTRLLRKIQSETKARMFIEENQAGERNERQQTLSDKILKLTVADLAELLNEADKIIPPVLGDPRFKFARYDVKNFIYCLHTINNEDQEDVISIFESSIEREKKWIQDNI